MKLQQAYKVSKLKALLNDSWQAIHSDALGNGSKNRTYLLLMTRTFVNIVVPSYEIIYKQTSLVASENMKNTKKFRRE